MNAIRAFIAIDLPADIRQQLQAVIKDLKTLVPSGVRWSSADHIHLTLQFLGESSSANLELLKQSLPAIVLHHQAFEFEVGGLGVFPNMRQPRVIWVGIQAGPALKNLQHSVEIETRHQGYPAEDRGFSPHLTLGRVNHSAAPQDIARISESLSKASIGVIGKVAVQKVTLFRSDLQPAGPIYSPLAVFPLSGPAK